MPVTWALKAISVCWEDNNVVIVAIVGCDNFHVSVVPFSCSMMTMQAASIAIFFDAPGSSIIIPSLLLSHGFGVDPVNAVIAKSGTKIMWLTKIG